MMIKQSSRLLFKHTSNSLAGHAKWQNIMHRKNAQDKVKGAASMKYVQMVAIAIKENNNDFNINTNNELKNVMDRAIQANVPKKNLLNVIDKFKNKDASKNEYKQFIFPIIGKNGISLVYDVFTDSPLSVRSAIFGAVKGIDGANNPKGLHFFEEQGEIIMEHTNKDLESMDDDQAEEFLEELTLSLLEKDVEFEDIEFSVQDNDAVALKVVCPADSVHQTFKDLKTVQDSVGCKVISSDVVYNPTSVMTISEEENNSLMKPLKKCMKLSEDVPDLKNLYVNFKIEE